MQDVQRTGSATDTGAAQHGASALLTSPGFLVAVALLLLNDWVLKAALGNWATGKLSDFAGLFAFALFWTALLPKRRTAVFALTGGGFLLWKSPLSEAPLAAWNALGVLPLARVVDYTDWLALVVLLPAYGLARRSGPGTSIQPPCLRRRITAVATAGIALVAFTATSMAPPSYNLPDPTGYPISATRGEVRAGLDSLDVYVIDLPSKRIAEGRQGPVDTLLVYIRQPPERPVGLKIEVREVAPAQSTIRLLTASAAGPEPKTESIHRAFREQVFEPLRDWVAPRRTPELR
jgi:hypothetical protein